MKNNRALGGQNKTVFMKMAAATSAVIGSEFKAEVFRLAFAKAKRWAVNAYGSADMSEYAGENGYELITFYKECAAKVQDTFNRQNYLGRIK
jgi:hypothetical protein